MFEKLKDRVRVQERTTDEKATGVTRSWTDVVTRWGRLVLVNLDGRARYEQVGYSNVTHQIIFRGKLDLSLAKTRFVVQGKVYEPVDPAGNPDGYDDFVVIPVRHVREEDP